MKVFDTISACAKQFSGKAKHFAGASIVSGVITNIEKDQITVVCDFRGDLVTAHRVDINDCIPKCKKCEYRLECLIASPETHQFLNRKSCINE